MFRKSFPLSSLPTIVLLLVSIFGVLFAEDVINTPVKQISYGNLMGLQISPDGQLFVTGSSDGNVRIWDANTGEVIKKYTVDDTGYVRTLAFSNDGKKILISFGFLHLEQYIGWLTISNGEISPIYLLPQLPQFYNPDYGKVQISADESMILIAGTDSGKIMNSECNKVLFEFKCYFGACELSPDGSYLFTTEETDDRNKTLLNVHNLKTGNTVTCRTNDIFNHNISATFLPDGDNIIISENPYFTLYNIHTGAVLDSFPYPPSIMNFDDVASSDIFRIECAYSKDGSQFFAGNALWDAKTHVLIRKLYGPEELCMQAAFFPDNQKIILSSDFGNIDIFNINTGKIQLSNSNYLYISTDYDSRYIDPFDFSPDGSKMLTGGDFMVREWNITTGKATKRFNGHYDNVNSVVYSPNGKSILSGSDDNTSILWDLETGSKLRTFNMTGEVIFTGFSADETVAITMTEDSLKFWNISTGEPIKAVRNLDELACMTPDNRHLITSGPNHYRVRFWNPMTGDTIKSVPDRNSTVSYPKISPDGTLLLSDSNRCLVLWSATTGERVKVINAHKGHIADYAFSPDGSLIISGAEDDTVKIWNTTTGELLRTFTGETSTIIHVRFTGDGSKVLTAHKNNTTFLWDVSDLVNNKTVPKRSNVRDMQISVQIRNNTLFVSNIPFPSSYQSSMSLYTMSGKLVHRFKLHSSKQTLYQLPSTITEGIYYYTVTGENNTFAGRLSVIRN